MTRPLHIRARELFDLIDATGGGKIERACELADLLSDVAAAPTSDLHRLAMERATTVLEALVFVAAMEPKRAEPTHLIADGKDDREAFVSLRPGAMVRVDCTPRFIVGSFSDKRVQEMVDVFRGSIRELLSMLAMVPEKDLPGLRCDPFGTIGDALDLIGESRRPDPWTALFRMCGLGSPGEPPRTTYEQPCKWDVWARKAAQPDPED